MEGASLGDQQGVKQCGAFSGISSTNILSRDTSAVLTVLQKKLQDKEINFHNRNSQKHLKSFEVVAGRFEQIMLTDNLQTIGILPFES
eukprot:6473893-Amphidinium_carterae.1